MKNESLVQDLMRLARQAPKELAARLASLPLRQQAELVLRLPSKERLELLLHAPQPMRLVRALPDTEVYLTVREVGPADALPLLSLASADQVRHLVDLESWRGDRFDADRAGAWVALLLESGEPTILRFLRNADDELLALLFARWIRVKQIPVDDTPSIHGHGETEAGTEEGFLSPDGYHRFSPTIPSHGPAVRRIAEIFFQTDPHRYEQAIWSALWQLPSEMEEQELHWRQSRLEEHGFPTWEEALAVHAPPAGIRSRGEPLDTLRPDDLAAPRAALRVLDERSLLAQAVERLAVELGERVLTEITGVANRLLVADRADTGDAAAHRDALLKATSYVEIALAARGAADGPTASGTLGDVPIIELFREGFVLATNLQARARKLVREGWPSIAPRALEMLDAPIRPRLAGLVGKRPLYYDPAGGSGEVPYREFRSLGEIEETRVAVELAGILGRIVGERLGWDIGGILRGLAPQDDPPRFSTLFLTSLAWHVVREELRGGPLSREVLQAFAERTADPRAFDAYMKRLTHDLDPRTSTELLAFGRACFEKLEGESAALRRLPGIDPRLLTCLLLDSEA